MSSAPATAGPRRSSPARAVRHGLGLALVLVLGVLVVLVVVVPRATGGVALVVMSGSMAPAVPTGSVVVVHPVDPGEVGVGDVVTYQRDAGTVSYVTHRVVSVHTDPVPHLRTKGDANEAVDPEPVAAGAVRGTVTYAVPYVGWVAGSTGLLGSGEAVAVVVLLVYAAYQVLRAALGRRDAREPRDVPGPTGRTAELTRR